jgi:hypothetical protein
MPSRGVKSTVRYDGKVYHASGRSHHLKSEAKAEAKRLRGRGLSARVRRYSFGYQVYGRVK